MPETCLPEIAKETYEVQVAGLPIKLRSSHDESTVYELIQLVNQKVEEAQAGSPTISFQQALMLASLHLAEDLVFLKRAARKELDRLEVKTKEILSEVESSPVSRIRLDN